MTGEPDTDIARLWKALQQHADPAIRERLIEYYGEFARMMAAKLYGGRPDDAVPFDDYLQHARIGLIEAVDRYDPGHETSFESYSSYRIRGAILNGLSRDTELRAQHSQWRARVAERRESLARHSFEGQGKATLEDFARLAVGLAIGMILDDSDSGRADEAVEANPYAATELSQTREQVRALVEQLPPRERDIVRQHYYEQREFQEVAANLNLTKGRISQLHARALERIRSAISVKPKIDTKL